MRTRDSTIICIALREWKRLYKWACVSFALSECGYMREINSCKAKKAIANKWTKPITVITMCNAKEKTTTTTTTTTRRRMLWMCFYKSSDGWDDVRLSATAILYIMRGNGLGNRIPWWNRRKKTEQCNTNKRRNERTKTTGYKAKRAKDRNTDANERTIWRKKKQILFHTIQEQQPKDGEKRIARKRRKNINVFKV